MNNNYNPFEQNGFNQNPIQPEITNPPQQPVVEQPEVLEENQTFTQQENTVTDNLATLNTSTEQPTLEVKQKKGVNGPAIVIVLLLIVAITAGGFLLAYNNGIFESKKPQQPVQDELTNNIEEPPEEIFYTSNGSVVKYSDYSSVEISIKNTVNVVQDNNKTFNTLKENPATLRFSNTGTYYSLEKTGSLLRITKYTPSSNGEGVGSAKEIYRETIANVDYTFENGHVGKISPSIQGYVSGNYVLLEYTHSHKVGETLIMDKSFNVIQRHKHYEQNYPLATNTAIYYGIINCKGRRTDYTEGPAIETYMINTTSGEKTYLYNLDYKNENNHCK